jgi:hypothetical protein
LGFQSMTDSFIRLSLISFVAMTCLAATQAFAQAPTDAQRNAIKSSCRSDYMAHCSSVQPGGAAALQCLQKNLSSLSSGYQAAVKAVTSSTSEAKPVPAPAATESKAAAEPAKPPIEAAKPAAEAAPAAAPAKPAVATKPAASGTAAAAPAGKPSEAQIAAIRSSCRSDYPSVCAGVPTGGAEALQCLEKNKAKLSASCGAAVAAAAGGGSLPATDGAAAPATAAAPAAAAPVALVLRPLRPLEELRIVRAACGADARAFCSAMEPGGGRIAGCLAAHAAALSPPCRGMLEQFAAR